MPTVESTFFHTMPAMRHIRDITDPRHYQDVPADWLIALTDVRNSTKAIEQGRYKAVNTVAAATITAVLNNIPDHDVPFLFGGDGAALVVPPELEPQVRTALSAVRRLARQNFELEVRAALVPVADVLRSGVALKVGKLHVSENFQQPVFTGGGLEYADQLAKASTRYEVADDPNAQADFSGFECRWNKHPASKEEVVSLIVRVLTDDPAERKRLYDEVLAQIEQIYGEPEQRHPIRLDQMRVASDPAQYQNELGWKQEQVTFLDRLKLILYSWAGFLLWKYRSKIWDRYRSVVRDATDHEKFDDTLRMTISGTTRQREEIRAFLEAKRAAGELVYGTHTAQHSLMTCIVFDRFGRQVHFVDADEGGYALAAKEMKAQLARLLRA